MKKRTLLALLVLFVFSGNAQDPDPRIFSSWFIIEYIEDEVTYVAPDNYEIEIVEEGDQTCPHLFYLPNPFNSSWGCLGPINETQFVVLALGILTEGEICQGGPQECEDFFAVYQDLYSDAQNSGIPLSYTIEDQQNGLRRLTVTNEDGDRAIYRNQYLSVDELAKPQAIVYPNPVTEELFIRSATQIENVRIYSVQGKLVLESSSTTLDVTSMQNGLYFIEIASDEGKEIHKIIKQ